MKWNAFRLSEQTYDLRHLDAFSHVYEVPSAGGKPAEIFNVDVTFSHHCFTSSLPKSGAVDRTLLYSDAREKRLFDERRYVLSHRLPDIVRSMLRRKCRHTGHGNFFTIELVDEAGRREDYDIFFQASRSSTRGRVNLYVQSAFIRDTGKLPATRPIRFEIILHNILHGKPIRS